VAFEDLPLSIRAWLDPIRTPEEFSAYRDRLNRESEERVRRGERESLIYYVLEARGFTAEPALEPAALASQFAEDGPLPARVQARFAAFRSACGRPGRSDERLQYFCRLSHQGEDLTAAYPDAIRFLRRKEVDSLRLAGDARRDFVAALYRTRGLSSDSSFDANFPVYLALRSLAAQPNPRIERVLIVGPGLDFAPRTGLDDSIAPQSLQPYAVADALLQLGLAGPDRLRIHAADINPRVAGWFDGRSATSLTVSAHEGPEEYRRYFEEFGRAIGKSSVAAGIKKIEVSPAVAARVTAERLNILTERPCAASGFDLVVATNILVYFDRRELALAFANIAGLLREGGYFIHNELRQEVEELGAAAGMPVADARMIRLFQNDRRALFDGQVVHRKAARL
jgi:hypothetical protein